MKTIRKFAILMIALVVSGFALAGTASAGKNVYNGDVTQVQTVYISQEIDGAKGPAYNIADVDLTQVAITGKNKGDITQVQETGINQKIKGPKEKPHKAKKHKQAPQDDPANVAIVEGTQIVS